MIKDATLGIAARNVEGRYTFANSCYQELVSSAREVVNATDFDLLPECGARALWAGHEEVMASGSHVHIRQQIGAGLEARHLLFEVFPVRDDRGATVGSGVVAVDVTEEMSSFDFVEKTLEHVNLLTSRLLEETARLERLATSDSLTGAWNRRWLEEASKGEIYRMRRYRHPVSLILLDIDHFKQINDQLGHPTGDRVLVALADAVRAACRGSDSLTRWGGEEFAVLAPNTDRVGARMMADRIAASIRGWVFPVVQPVTVSMGVAEFLSKEDFADWVERTDQALYAAKAAGRNRIMVDPASDCPEDDDGRIAHHFLQFVWKDAYCCGHELIDHQHQSLFSQANLLLASLLSGRPKQELGRIVVLLLDEVTRHFTDEEYILAELTYPEIDKHISEHKRLLHRAGELKDAFDNNCLKGGDLFEYLAQDVIAGHMLGTDREYFSYMKTTPSIGSEVGPIAASPPH
ncbi:MAG: diguanylate cyclase [Rhodospirillaceae bacterium]